jgi:FtsP/CotA-like multicopper oxidase with cupredoxin domain
MKIKLERSLFLLISALYCFIAPASSYDDYESLTDYYSSFTHLPFTNKPVTRHYHLKLRKTKLSLDGFERQVWTANDIYPGPILRANKGDRIVVEVTNYLGEYTSIHWHGMLQLETNWYDGAPGFVSY